MYSRNARSLSHVDSLSWDNLSGENANRENRQPETDAFNFLRENGLLNEAPVVTSELSGDLSGYTGRKSFTSCTVLPSVYTTKYACTGAGHNWNSGGNNAPTNIGLDNSSIGDASTGAGAVIGSLSTTDADGGDTHTYSLVTNGASGSGSCGASGDDDNASFQVDNANKDLETAGSVTAGSYNVCIQTHDGTDSFQKTFSITVSDTTAPAFENATPSVGTLTFTGGTLSVDLNEEGTAYYVVVADGAGAPSAGQVKAGQDSGGGAPLTSGSFATAGTTGSEAFTGLSAGTAYDLYAVAEDDEGSPNLQASATLVNFTTASPNSDGDLSAAGGVSEPMGLDTTVDTVGEAVNVFDFTLSDGGTSDGLAMAISQVVVNVSGTSTDTERANITWRLNGNDASNVTGVYNAGSDTITFSGLSISVANGSSETYTVNAYYNNNSAVTEDHTVILSVDGDTDLTVAGSGTQMGITSAVTNGTGTTLDVVASTLVFTTQPSGSTSGSAISTQPVVAARDAFGNTDLDFAETVTLTESSAGTLSGDVDIMAVNGVSTFTNLIYTATADQQSFTLTANDEDGVGTNLPAVDANPVTSDVVATKLVFSTQPAPTSITTGISNSFSTVPVVQAQDVNNVTDTGYSTDIVLSVTDPNDSVVDGTVNSLTGTGDQDGSGTTVTLTPASGSATFTGLAIQYTNNALVDTLALRATSGGLTAVNSTNITSGTPPTVTDGNISISGDSGQGGAYKTGDTVTVTWNNSAGGDNNSGITAVSVDFSAFGGGAAVAASENAGVWTATYTITSGTVDGTNLNVSVSVTGSSGVTTRSDTTNATVDNQAPVVTDGNISVSGASGIGGAFKSGDQVTVSWNNSAGGDNNSDTLNGVTVNFSAFGGGSAVAASENAGIWSATYTLADGLDGSNWNASVRVVDNAGNSTTTADTSNARVDSTLPVVPVLGSPTEAIFINAANYQLQGTHSENAVSIELEEYLDVCGTLEYTFVDSIAVASNSWQFTRALNQDSEHQYRIRAVDAVGNASSYVVVPLIIEDSTAPVAAVVTTPAAPQSVTSASQTISGTHSENGITVALYADSNNDGIADNSTVLASGQVATNAWTLSAPLSIGANNFVVVAKDKADNSSAAVDVPTLTRTNSTPPPPTNIAPQISGAPAGSVNAGQSYSFIPSAADADGDSLTFSIGNQPGWATFNPLTGALTGTPGNAQAGIFTGIVITVSDGQATASLPAFNIQVNAVASPVGQNMQLSGAEDQGLTITPQLQDPQGQALTIELVGGPTHGTLNSAGLGWHYQPDKDYHGEDSFSYRVRAGQQNSEDYSVTIQLSPVNDAPVAMADELVLAFNQSGNYSLDVLSNDNDVDGDTLQIQSARTSVGSVTVSAGRLNWQPPAGYQGSAGLSYRISDGQGGTSQTTVNASIEGGDTSAPIVTPPADITVNATGLFTKVDLGSATASDSQGNALAVSLVAGNTLLAPGLHKVYWQATDSAGRSNTASQTVRVVPLVSLSKDQVVSEGNQVTIRAILNGPSPEYPVSIPYSVSGSADAADHDLQDGVMNIAAGLESSVSFSILSDALAEPEESVVIGLSPSLNLGARSSTRISIRDGNIAPKISLSVQQQGKTQLSVSQEGGNVTVFAQVTDPNPSDQITLEWQSGFDNLSTADNEFVFNPSSVSPGIYSVTLLASDNGNPNLIARESVFVDVAASLPELTDADTDGDLIPDNEEGFADSDADGIPDYLDAINECNVMPETLETRLGFLAEGEPGACLRKGSVAATNRLGGLQLGEEQMTNQLPGDDGAVNVGGLFDFIAYGLPEAGQSYRLVIPQQLPVPQGGVYRKFVSGQWQDFVLDADNQVFSTLGEPGICPPPGDAQWQSGLTPGHHCVQLQIQDGGPNDDDGVANGSIVDPGGVAVPLNGNQQPLAQDDVVSMTWNTSIELDVLANDQDSDGDSLTISSASVELGQVVIENNKLHFTPPQDYGGVINISYSISDGKGGTSTANVQVTIVANQSPIALPDEATTEQGTALNIVVMSNDSDPDGDPLTLISASAQRGNVSINADGTLRYSPEAGFSGTDVITYLIEDNNGAQAQGLVSVTVKAMEKVTVVNKSSGGGLGAWLVLLMLLSMFRGREKNL
ncbi:Ig-like domain-containing protein [Bowmanella denitrificans]|uniref:Ig-like domain-containing protein n=1 Tax=Bowmanella denitrificans TaxID=366582 RepID=UPI0015595F86|nr:Ig-like domain-containing protein [Bowmanella denitrificans]